MHLLDSPDCGHNFMSTLCKSYERDTKMVLKMVATSSHTSLTE